MERTSILWRRRSCCESATFVFFHLCSSCSCWPFLIAQTLVRPSLLKQHDLETDDCTGNAKIQGMTKDLDMEGKNAGRYNIALFIFFIPYILFEIPSNLILKKLAPSTWLSLIMVLWGMSATSISLPALTTSRHFHHRHGSGDELWRSMCDANPVGSLRSGPVSW
jgi:hypothetical protein